MEFHFFVKCPLDPIIRQASTSPHIFGAGTLSILIARILDSFTLKTQYTVFLRGAQNDMSLLILGINRKEYAEQTLPFRTLSLIAGF